MRTTQVHFTIFHLCHYFIYKKYVCLYGVYLWCISILKGFSRPKLVVPWIVIQELDALKDAKDSKMVGKFGIICCFSVLISHMDEAQIVLPFWVCLLFIDMP